MSLMKAFHSVINNAGENDDVIIYVELKIIITGETIRVYTDCLFQFPDGLCQPRYTTTHLLHYMTSFKFWRRCVVYQMNNLKVLQQLNFVTICHSALLQRG